MKGMARWLYWKVDDYHTSWACVLSVPQPLAGCCYRGQLELASPAHPLGVEQEVPDTVSEAIFTFIKTATGCFLKAEEGQAENRQKSCLLRLCFCL